MPLRKLTSWLQRGKPTVDASEPMIAPLPTADYVDSRDCGLVDLVQSGWFQNETSELFTGFPVSASDVLLDVGCGAGAATLFAANRGAHVIFSDVVETKVESLRQRVAATPARQAQGLVSDTDPLPLADATASRVVALEMLEHVADPGKVLGELVRVGQPGALYLLAVPDARGEQMQKSFAPASYFKAPNHIHIFEREEFAQLIRDAGLSIEQQGTYGFFWTMWMFIYWTWAESTGQDLDNMPHDVVQPPYPQLIDDWARLWHTIIKLPASAPMKQALDELLPKSQVIVARKPL